MLWVDFMGFGWRMGRPGSDETGSDETGPDETDTVRPWSRRIRVFSPDSETVREYPFDSFTDRYRAA